MKPKLHTIISGYFPNALEAIAHHAQYGNDKHNGAGAPLHWAFNKSTEHAESAQRHLQKAGTVDPETGKSHTIGLVVRALMLLETELLAAGADPGWAVDMGQPCAEPCGACEEAKEPYGGMYEIVDTNPRVSGYQLFEGRLFTSRAAAGLALVEEAGEPYWKDFDIREVKP